MIASDLPQKSTKKTHIFLIRPLIKNQLDILLRQLDKIGKLIIHLNIYMETELNTDTFRMVRGYIIKRVLQAILGKYFDETQ